MLRIFFEFSSIIISLLDKKAAGRLPSLATNYMSRSFCNAKRKKRNSSAGLFSPIMVSVMMLFCEWPRYLIARLKLTFEHDISKVNPENCSESRLEDTSTSIVYIISLSIVRQTVRFSFFFFHLKRFLYKVLKKPNVFLVSKINI